MNIKERASYAWGRICSIFKKKKPDIEVEIEEEKPSAPAEEPAPAEAPVQAEEAVPAEKAAPEAEEETTDEDLSPDDIEVEIYEETEEKAAEPEADDAQPAEEAPKRDVLTPTADPVPSRMTDEYIAWMKAQREAADAENNRGPFQTEQ